MPNNSNFLPGWYDNGRGAQQWHDGTNWTPSFQPQAKKPRRQVPLIALAWTSAAALLFGVIIGSASASGRPVADSPPVAIATSTPAPEVADPVVDSATVSLAAAQAQLKTDTAAVDAREKKVSATETALKKDQKALTKAQKKVDRKAKKLQDKADDPDPIYAYYQNCDAARAAGAAPVYSGDPGYGAHLDRDGDGVGCE